MRRNSRKRTMPEGLAPAAKGEPPLRTRGRAQARKMPPGAARSGRECGERARPCPFTRPADSGASTGISVFCWP